MPQNDVDMDVISMSMNQKGILFVSNSSASRKNSLVWNIDKYC